LPPVINASGVCTTPVRLATALRESIRPLSGGQFINCSPTRYPIDCETGRQTTLVRALCLSQLPVYAYVIISSLFCNTEKCFPVFIPINPHCRD
jgi:hypothetical protein